MYCTCRICRAVRWACIDGVLQDSLHQRAAWLSIEEQLDLAVEGLQSTCQLSDGEDEPVQVAYLQWVASVRFGLTVAAQRIGEWITNSRDTLSNAAKKRWFPLRRRQGSLTSTELAMPDAIRMLIQSSQKLCQLLQDCHVPLFLVKQLVRKFGSHLVKHVQEHKELSWLLDYLSLGSVRQRFYQRTVKV